MPQMYDPRLTRWAEDLRKYLKSIGIQTDGDSITNIYNNGNEFGWGPYRWNDATVDNTDYTIPDEYKNGCLRLVLSNPSAARKIIMPTVGEGEWIFMFVDCGTPSSWSGSNGYKLYKPDGATLLYTYTYNTIWKGQAQCIYDKSDELFWFFWHSTTLEVIDTPVV